MAALSNRSMIAPRSRRLRGPYNLISDPEEYPEFSGFDERGEYIMEDLLNCFIAQVEDIVEEELAAEFSQDPGAPDEEDFEDLDENEEDLGQSPPYAGPDGSPESEAEERAWGRAEGEIEGRFWRDAAQLSPQLEDERNRGQDMEVPDVDWDDMDDGVHLERSRDQIVPSMSSPSSARRNDTRGWGSRSGGDSRAESSRQARTRSRGSDHDESESESADSDSGRSGVRPASGSRGRGRRAESPNGRRGRDRSRSRSRGRSPERNGWRRNLNLNIAGQEAAAEPVNLLPPLLHHMSLEERMKPHMDKLNISFVGDQHPESAFEPCRGDLIIAHPGGRRPGLPNSVGYLASYLGPNSYVFSNRELVVRSGDFEVRPPVRGGIQSFVYRPYRDLELYAYSIRGSSKWKYLGGQASIKNVVIPLDHDSPGKYLKVGSPVLGSYHFMALIPRRGDLIIKGESWIESFSHKANFWRSMVKWHRNEQVDWAPGDMLVRRFVDKDQSGGPHRWGWAELYQFEGPGLGWVFWGRTLHVYDTPWPERSFYTVTYFCDDGTNTDNESNANHNVHSNGFRPR